VSWMVEKCMTNLSSKKYCNNTSWKTRSRSVKNWESYIGLCASVGRTRNGISWLLFRMYWDVLMLYKSENCYVRFEF
jgi:hypothetical protein